MEFKYTEVDQIKNALVGHSIVDTISQGDDYNRVLTFVLDNGTRLKAHATDGGCGCSNGCFTVEPGGDVRGTITNVVVNEIASDYMGNDPREIEPGSISDGESVISIFVYADIGQQVLVESSGEDNGYYGWGFWFSVERPESEEI